MLKIGSYTLNMLYAIRNILLPALQEAAHQKYTGLCIR